jgi:hypothetical protein
MKDMSAVSPLTIEDFERLPAELSHQSFRDAILDENEHFRSSLIPGFSIRLGDLFDQI